MAGCGRWAGVAVLAALMCAGTTSAHEVLKPSKLYKFATNETSFTAKFENKGLGFAYIIMQPCLGHNLILYLSDDEIDSDTPVACNFTEADRCEMYYSEVETVYLKVTGAHIDSPAAQMVFELMVLPTNRTYEAQPLITEKPQLTRGFVLHNRATVRWDAAYDEDDHDDGGADTVSVYRLDVPTHEGFHAADLMPPRNHFLTACSVRRWMREDKDATQSVSTRYTAAGEFQGSATVGNLSRANATFVAVLVQRGKSFGSAYQVLVYNAAERSTPLVVVVVVVVALVAVLLCAAGLALTKGADD